MSNSKKPPLTVGDSSETALQREQRFVKEAVRRQIDFGRKGIKRRKGYAW